MTVIQGSATFASPNAITVDGADGRTTVGFDHRIIAAGSRVARLPNLPYDDPRLMDSTDALALEDVPERLLVIGGGIIGREMATVDDALGARVTVVELMDSLIPGCDKDLVRPLHKRIEKRYEAIHLTTKVSTIEPLEDGLRVTFEGDKAAEPGLSYTDPEVAWMGLHRDRGEGPGRSKRLPRALHRLPRPPLEASPTGDLT